MKRGSKGRLPGTDRTHACFPLNALTISHFLPCPISKYIAPKKFQVSTSHQQNKTISLCSLEIMIMFLCFSKPLGGPHLEKRELDLTEVTCKTCEYKKQQTKTDHPEHINGIVSFYPDVEWEARWPHGQCTRLRSERSAFEPWPGTLCCVLGQDTSLPQCLS